MARCDSAVTLKVRAERARSFRVRRIGGRVSLKEISRTYEAIRPATAASYLGLDSASAEHNDPAIIQRFTACGWTWNEETKLLHPKPIVTPPGPDHRLSNELGEVMALISNHGK